MNRAARLALLLAWAMTTSSRTIVLSAIVTLGWPSAQAMAADGWGASYSFNAVQPPATNHVTYAKTTIVPGRLPVSTGPRRA